MANERPQGVTALGVMAICLGIMGLLGGAVGIAGLFIPQQKPVQDASNPKAAQVAAEFQRRVEQTAKETKKTSLIAIPILMVVSLLLAAGGLSALQLKAPGFVKTAFAVSLLADTMGAIYNIIIQMKMMDITKWYSRELAGASNMPGMEMVMSISIYTGLFFAVGWMIAKAAFYIVGLVYFGKSKVREAFDGGAAPATPL